jgi:hypothetical protein
MLSSRARQVPSRMGRQARPVPSKMGRQDRSPEYVPEDDVVDITLDNYLVNLLREEEMIEAIRTVDWEKASKMSHRLEVDLQKPWHYLNKHQKYTTRRGYRHVESSSKKLRKSKQSTTKLLLKSTPQWRSLPATNTAPSRLPQSHPEKNDTPSAHPTAHVPDPADSITSYKKTKTPPKTSKSPNKRSSTISSDTESELLETDSMSIT